jgi:SAM-dependent methyltransferase
MKTNPLPTGPGVRILDVGGWLSPVDGATHVVDLFPYATRRGRLALDPEPGERFTRETWHQADFLHPDLRLPYPDGFFDFAYCGHTLEDLENPVPLLREIARIARGGRVLSPSRLVEQTLGVRDRASRFPGHPHHRWILDAGPGGLEFCPKAPSIRRSSNLVPLMLFEKWVTLDSSRYHIDWVWQGPVRWSLLDDSTAESRAAEFAGSLGISPYIRLQDHLLRMGRRCRNRLAGKPKDDPTSWLKSVVALSRPHSLIPL